MTDPIDARIDAVLPQLTLAEKVAMCHAATSFTPGGVERLGLKPLLMSDGPHGVRREVGPAWDGVEAADDAVTYLPTGTALAATWNRDRAADFGAVLGAEARARGKDVILGPGINIVRTPLCGRNFEYYGEDPYHIACLVVPVIEAIQAQGVAACVKHFACNNQELNRFHTDVVCDERTLREIYLPGFEAAVREAGVLTLMGAYNKFRGQHCCHHPYLLDQILRREWGFTGLVVSDWGGVHDTDEAAWHSLDIEMGGRLDALYLDQPFRQHLEDGTYPEHLLNDKVRHILRVMYTLAHDEERPDGAKNTAHHQAVARQIAVESQVLLKNDDAVLPLDPAKIGTLAVIGENADLAHASGGGSSAVPALYEITPLQALRERLGDTVEIVHVPGYPTDPTGLRQIPGDQLAAVDQAGIGAWRLEVFDNRHLKGTPIHVDTCSAVDFSCESAPEGLEPERWSLRWRATVTPAVGGDYRLVVRGGDSFRVLIDGETIASAWSLTAPGVVIETMTLEAGRAYTIDIQLQPSGRGGSMRFGWVLPGTDITGDADPHAEAVAAAQRADAVLVFAGSTHLQDVEGQDRSDYDLTGGQNELIRAVAAANPRTAVFLIGGSAVALPWIDEVPAVVQSWYAGMEGGRAMADVALGAACPSGRLPFSWPVRLADCAAHHFGDYRADRSFYREGIRVGYRWHDDGGPAPLFCFGHGLSYTSFAYRDLHISTDTDDDAVAAVRLTVANTGSRAGAEVVQLYLQDDDASVPRPPRELKGFAKIALAPGEEGDVHFTLHKRDLSFWDSAAHAWRAEPGRFTVHVGASSRDLRLTGRFDYG